MDLSTFVATYIGAHAIWSASLTLCQLLHRAIASGKGASRFAPLAGFVEDDFTRRRVGNYVLSIIHSSVTSAVSLWLLCRRGLVGPGCTALYDPRTVESAAGVVEGSAPLWLSTRLLSFSVAYFLHDLVSTMQDWHRNPLDIAHHVAGVLLTSSPLVSPAASALGHHILVTELSTPPLNSMWFLRKGGLEGGALYKGVAFTFVGLFALTRLVYLPLATALTFAHVGRLVWSSTPHCAVLMVALNGLNFYWWHRIVLMLRRGKADHAPHMSEAEYQRSLAQQQQQQQSGKGADGPGDHRAGSGVASGAVHEGRPSLGSVGVGTQGGLVLATDSEEDGQGEGERTEEAGAPRRNSRIIYKAAQDGLLSTGSRSSSRGRQRAASGSSAAASSSPSPTDGSLTVKARLLAPASADGAVVGVVHTGPTGPQRRRVTGLSGTAAAGASEVQAQETLAGASGASSRRSSVR